MVGRLYLNLGIVAEMAEKFKDSIVFLQRARKTVQGHGLVDDEEKCLSMLAAMYQKIGDFINAEEMAEISYGLLKKGKSKSLCALYDNLLLRSGIFMERKKFDEARHCLKRVTKSKHSDIAQKSRAWKQIKSMEKIRNSLRQLNQDELPDMTKIELFENVADEFCSVECFFSGLSYYKAMLKVAERLQKPNPELAAIYVSLSQTCCDLKMYRQAITYAVKETKLRTDPEELCRTWLNVAEYSYHCGDDDGFTIDLYNK